MFSACLVTGGKLNAENITILGKLAEAIIANDLTYFIGADWQVPPEAIKELDWLGVIRGNLKFGDPSIGTCTVKKSAANIDYLLVSSKIDQLVDVVTTDINSIAQPHRGVAVAACLGAGRKVPKQVVHKIGPRRVVGPLPAPPNYRTVAAAAKDSLDRIAGDGVEI